MRAFTQGDRVYPDFDPQSNCEPWRLCPAVVVSNHIFKRLHKARKRAGAVAPALLLCPQPNIRIVLGGGKARMQSKRDRWNGMKNCCQIVATERFKWSKILDFQGFAASLKSFPLAELNPFLNFFV